LIKFIIIAIAVIVLGKICINLFVQWMLYHPSRTVEFMPQEFGLKSEDIYFSSSNGLKLNGLFFPAPNARITMILFHGNAENVGDRLDFIKMLVGLGLNVFYFDYQGYGRSQGNPTEQGTYEDGLAAYGYVRSRADVDPERIAFYGRSLGGGIAIDVAARTGCYRLITEGAFASIKEMAKGFVPVIPFQYTVPDKYNNVKKIAALNMPYLIIHGTEDGTVPFSHGKKLFDAANDPKEFYPVDNAGHNDVHVVADKAFWEKISGFLDL